MDIMEDRGIIGPAEGARPRQVLIQNMDEVMPEPQPAQTAAAPAGSDVYDEIPLDDE
jgi:hypothetical protein